MITQVLESYLHEGTWCAKFRALENDFQNFRQFL